MRRRVLHVTPFLWSGAGSVITRLCLDQQRHHRVALVTSGHSKGERDWPSYVSQLDAAGVARHSIDFFDRDPAVFWSSVDALARIVRTWKPDVVHAHAGVPASAAAVVRAQARRPFALVAHLYSWATGRPAWMNVMDLQGFAAADRVVCSAEAYRRTLVDAGIPSSRIAYIPWGLDLAALRASAPRSPIPDPLFQTPDPRSPIPDPRSLTPDPFLGFVGRIEPRKRQLDLVEGFARYRRRVAGARLELVGPVADAAYAREIARAVRAHRLDFSVSLPGLVPSVPSRLSQWDLFVSLSDDEGQGLAVLEAMALGVPVLARPVPGIEDYLRDGVTGLTLTDPNARTVAAAIGAAWSDRVSLRDMAARARRMVDRRYTWKQTVQRIEKVYAHAAA